MKATSLVRNAFAAAAALTLIVAARPAAATPPSTVTVEMTPGVSSPAGVIADLGGGGPVAKYLYTPVYAGSTLNDSIPANICLTAATGTGWSATFDFNISGGLPGSPAVDVSPSSVTFSQANGDVPGTTCQSVWINIHTDALADLVAGVDYVQNVMLQKDNGASASNATIDGKSHVQIRVEVEPPQGPTCFATDSDFNYLFACDGTTPQLSGTDGRFSIVTNRKNIEVATNPGQFYYNVLWTNSSGSAVVVDVAFVRSGVVPNGAQAIHAAVFAPAFSGATQANFDLVNGAIPGGKADAISGVTVPAGYTLWVDYHLEWKGLGLVAPLNAASTCSTANQAWTVSATLSSGGVPIGSQPCVAGGTGYLKK